MIWRRVVPSVKVLSTTISPVGNVPA